MAEREGESRKENSGSQTLACVRITRRLCSNTQRARPRASDSAGQGGACRSAFLAHSQVLPKLSSEAATWRDTGVCSSRSGREYVLKNRRSNPGAGRVEFRAGSVPVGDVRPLWTMQRQGSEQNPASLQSAAHGQRRSSIWPSITRMSEEYTLIHMVLSSNKMLSGCLLHFL